MKNEANSYYVYIKEFDRSMYSKAEHKDEKISHKLFTMLQQQRNRDKSLRNLLKINGKRATKMPEKGSNVQFTGNN